MLIGRVQNPSTRSIGVLDDMPGSDRVAIEISQGRMGLNAHELALHIHHCQTALQLLESRVPDARQTVAMVRGLLQSVTPQENT